MSRPYMPLYVADYLSATEHLDATLSGAYLHLLMHYWQKGGLPQEDKFLARIARMSLKQWLAAKPTIKAFFNDDWTHDRAAREIDNASAKAEARATFGARGGRAKALKNKETSLAKASDLSKQTASKTPSKSVPSSSGLLSIDTSVSIDSAPAPKYSPRDVLLECLSVEVADGVIAHRKSLRAPLTVLAARELVKGFLSTGDPDDAARVMVVRGWKGFNQGWYNDHKSGNRTNGSGQKNGSLIEASLRAIRREDERESVMRKQASSDIRDDAVRLLSQG